MRVQRVVMPVTGAESWTVVDDGWAAVEPVERYLAHLAGIERSPNTVSESHWVCWRFGLLVSNQCTVGLSGTVGLFELCRRYVAEVAVEALVVVPVHPAQGGEFDVVDAAPRALVGSADEFGLVETDDGFGEGALMPL